MATPWVILRRFLGVVPKHAEHEDSAAISTALRAPPRVTVLAVGLNACPEVTYPNKVPYLVTAGPCGLLICFSVGEAPIETTDLIMAREFLPPGNPLCQPTTGSAERVPQRTGSMPATCNLRSLALSAGLYAGDYVITELKINRSSDSAKLLRFFSREKVWLETKLINPLSAMDREWAPSGVVAHEGKLWFLDLSCGILSCDPLDVVPVLRFHHLPPGCYISEARPFLHSIRCISVSNHMLRYVHIARDLDLDGRVTEKKVVVWTGIPDPDGGDADHGIIWLKTYEMSFKKIWNDASYRATQLPPMIPEIVVLNPRHPNMVYFFLGRTLFGVDVPKHKFVGFVKDARKLVAPGCRHNVLPWDLPRSIANGLVEAIVPLREQCGSPASTSGSD